MAYPPLLLIREDTLEDLVLEGTLTMDVVYDGALTDYALVDRTFASTGKLARPKTATIEALVSPNGVPGLTRQGDQRIADVIGWLQQAQFDAQTLLIQFPGRPQIDSMVVERFSKREDNTDTPGVSVQLKEVRIAQTSAVVLPPRVVPTPPAAPGLAAEADAGVRASVAAKFLDATTNFVFGAP